MSNETLADKILWIVDGRKCESCTDEECLGKDCEGCLADCLLALFTEQLAGLVEALKNIYKQAHELGYCSNIEFEAKKALEGR